MISMFETIFPWTKHILVGSNNQPFLHRFVHDFQGRGTSRDLYICLTCTSV